MSLICNQPGLFSSPTEVGASPRELLFVIEIPGRLPSLNELLGMQHWSRVGLKTRLQKEFSSALRASAKDSSTKITSWQSIMWTAADTLDSYVRTHREQQKLRSAKKRLKAKNQSASESKSSDGKVPF